MSLTIAFLLAGAVGLFGITLGYYLRLVVSLSRKESLEREIKHMIISAEEKAKKIVVEAETKAVETLAELRREVREKEEKIKTTESRLMKKEDTLEKRQSDIEKEVEHVKKKITEIHEIKEKAEALQIYRQKALEQTARMSEDDARDALFTVIEAKHADDLFSRIRRFESHAEERLQERSKEILAAVIQRLATHVSSDVFCSYVTLPSEDMKGKIIGKEGRNIKAFERATGVELIVDDTPGTITLSCFDPVRRHVAKVALDNLIADGRIQPAKIEEIVAKAEIEINVMIREEGERAVYECGVFNLDPRIVLILGRLHFRTSYGQNVLQHSIECAHLAGMIAEEIGANVTIAKAGALLHDIGKAVDHEVAGSHVEIGRRILQKFGADPLIVKAMEAHHNEYPYETIESRIVQTADAISGGRPGARNDSIENYLKRLADLEAIANSFEGVEKSYALQAGREIRIFVTPEEVTDFAAHEMAHEIALRIEEELRYPGEIKVSIIRETRCIEYAR